MSILQAQNKELSKSMKAMQISEENNRRIIAQINKELEVKKNYVECAERNTTLEGKVCLSTQILCI